MWREAVSVVDGGLQCLRLGELQCRKSWKRTHVTTELASRSREKRSPDSQRPEWRRSGSVFQPLNLCTMAPLCGRVEPPSGCLRETPSLRLVPEFSGVDFRSLHDKRH